MGKPVDVFISYSHKDEDLKDELYVHLAPLIRQGQIKPWQDRAIEAGAEWEQEIKTRLESAEIILLLITPRFIASDYCFDKEMQRAMARHNAGTARVIPVIMKPCYWQGSAFSKLQALPKDAKPVTRWDDWDEALLDVVQGMLRVIAGRQQQGDLEQKPAPAKQDAVQKPVPIDVPTVLDPPVVKEQASTDDFTERLSNGVELEMVKIQAGQFWMGSPDSDSQGDSSERPQHLVAVSEFWLGKYPVTQAQWTEVAALPKVECELEPFPSHFKGATLPVEQVSWYEAVEFCQRLSQATGRAYRLPSEAEWEYACRAGTDTPYSFGDTITGEQVNCDFRKTVVVSEGLMGLGRKEEKRGTYREKTTAVGSFSSNAWDLYDMHGNVWEWCADHGHSNYYDYPSDGSPWLSDDESSSRVIRGGSWLIDPESCRSARRYIFFLPDYHYDEVAFRVVSAPPRILQ
ncbi:serine threonine-protein kinase pkn1 [Leptolyngbya sp. Heron Island J]|uniref:SUMF1/EgtB/PvdO family nonheme iron enzyme n=1 Tax=Leptolyngbya sp. Heron Island J TaxID=1385935 RepID=UPI0003B95AB8|nr:SUMF1/EgtB/PvdO family nonheme iron enzyme [Leptolyngbya sp. Heron Island J]ESA33450.1 serine threonine-protein kinase pkn1 [Leptolyngbya sp. Heron Island J]